MRLTAHVDREEALAFLGHRGQELGDDLRERLERAANLVESELSPRGVWRALDLAEALRILTGDDIARHVEGCDEVVLMAVTLGAESEMLLRREQAVSPTDGLLVDACASSLAEQAAAELNLLILGEAAVHGLIATARFSPGYGDLPLSCQGALLAACGADRALGIRVTEADLLVPTKSITAAIGLRSAFHDAPAPLAGWVPAGPSFAVDLPEWEGEPPFTGLAEEPPCAICVMLDNCPLRAQGRTCHGTPA